MAQEGHLGFVHQISFDPSGRRFFSVSIEGSIAEWDVASRALVGRFEVHDGPINAIVVGDDSIVSAGFDGALRVSTPGGKVLREVVFDVPLHALDVVGEDILVGRADGAISIISPHGERTFEAHDDAVECLTVCRDYVISGGRDGSVVCWDAGSATRSSVLRGHGGWVTRVARLDAAHIVTTGEDGLVIGWDLERAEADWRVDLEEPIWGLAVDAASRRAYVGPAGAPLSLDLDTREMATIAGIEGFAARAIDVRSDGAVVLGDDGGAVHFLASGSLTPTWTVDGRHRGVITAAVLGNRVIAGHQDGSVALSRRDGTWRRVVAHEYMAYTSAAIDDGRVATGGLDGTILVWTGDEAPAARLEHGGSVFSLSVAQHSGALLSAGADRWIEWDVATGEIRHAAYDIGSGIHTLADIDASGSLIVTVGENARLVVWQNRRAVATWPLPYQDSSAIRVLPDGSGALVAFNDGVIGLVALDTGEFVELHRRHDCWIRQLLVSGDGRFMVSCSQNGVGAVYDRRTGRVRPLGGEGPLAAVALGRDDRVTLLSAEGASRQVDLLA